MSDWMAQVAKVYRDVVRERTAEDDTVERRTAFAFAAERLHDMANREEIIFPLDDIIHSALLQVDERDGGVTDSAIRSFAAGQYSAEVDGDPVLDMVVTLGRGRRKLWRDFNADDLIELDRLRFANVAAAKKAYDEWRKLYDPLFARLTAAGTIGDLAGVEGAA